VIHREFRPPVFRGRASPPTAAPANSSRSEIRRSPPSGTAHLAHSSTRTQRKGKGQPGGDPSRISTTRFPCTCPPFHNKQQRFGLKLGSTPFMALRIWHILRLERKVRTTKDLTFRAHRLQSRC
jgi:hypothetical protein